MHSKPCTHARPPARTHARTRASARAPRPPHLSQLDPTAVAALVEIIGEVNPNITGAVIPAIGSLNGNAVSIIKNLLPGVNGMDPDTIVGLANMAAGLSPEVWDALIQLVDLGVPAINLAGWKLANLPISIGPPAPFTQTQGNNFHLPFWNSWGRRH